MTSNISVNADVRGCSALTQKMVRTLRAVSFFEIAQAANFDDFGNVCRRAQRRTFLTTCFHASQIFAIFVFLMILFFENRVYSGLFLLFSGGLGVPPPWSFDFF